MKIEVAELTEKDKKERKLPKVTFSFGVFKNLKIQITDQQSLDEVVETLESKGYKKYSWYGLDKISHIVTWDDGDYSDYSLDGLVSVFDLEDVYKETTLAELKEM